MIAEIVLRGWQEVLFYGLLFIIVLDVVCVDLPKGINWILDKIQERRTKKEIEMDSKIYHEWFEEHEEELYQKWIKAMKEKHSKDFKVDFKEEEL